MPKTDVTVELVGTSGNAFAVLAKVKREMSRAGVDSEVIAAFMEEATGGDYDHLLRTVMEYVEVA